jgi:hypothetical protein
MTEYREDWSHHLLRCEALLRQITDASNERDYIKALSAVVEMRAESMQLKQWLVSEIMEDE